MLFNSYRFIFLFLPVCLLGYALLGKLRNRSLAIAWLVLCSIYYYGWWKAAEYDHWSARFLLVMLLSVAVNFQLGSMLVTCIERGRPILLRRLLLAAGILFNFGLLCYFKYTGFFLSVANSRLGTSIPIPLIVLPLAFSFHTFQQHAYLVDAYRGLVGRYSLLDYSLFVLFFPQLLAGPITHHHEMLPQFESHRVGRLHARHGAVGLTLFIFGLSI